jgi:hypothetical protein
MTANLSLDANSFSKNLGFLSQRKMARPATKERLEYPVIPTLLRRLLGVLVCPVPAGVEIPHRNLP